MEVEAFRPLAYLPRRDRQQNPLVTKVDITRIEAFQQRIQKLLVTSIGRLATSGPVAPSEVRDLLRKLNKNRDSLAAFLQSFFDLFTSPEKAKEDFGTYILRNSVQNNKLQEPLAINASLEEVDTWVRTGRSNKHDDFMSHLERYLITSFKNTKNVERLKSELPTDIDQAAGVLLLGPEVRTGTLLEVFASTKGLLIIQIAAPALITSQDQLDRIPDMSRFVYLQNKAEQYSEVRLQVYRSSRSPINAASFLLGQLIPNMRPDARLYIAGFEDSEELVSIWETLEMPNKPFAAYFENKAYDLGSSIAAAREDSMSWVPNSKLFEREYRWLTSRAALLLSDAEWRALNVPASQDRVLDFIESDLSDMEEQRGLFFLIWVQWWAFRNNLPVPSALRKGPRNLLETVKLRLGYSDYWYKDLRSAMRTDYYQQLFGDRTVRANSNLTIYNEYQVAGHKLSDAELQVLAQAVPEWSREAPFSAFVDFLHYDSELVSAYNIAVLDWNDRSVSRYVYIPRDDEYVYYLLRNELWAIDEFVEPSRKEKADASSVSSEPDSVSSSSSESESLSFGEDELEMFS